MSSFCLFQASRYGLHSQRLYEVLPNIISARSPPRYIGVLSLSRRSFSSSEQHPKHPKRKLALTVGYDGSYFFGSQLQPGLPTVDDSIFKALADAELLGDPQNAEGPSKVGWSRASRTDRGVHALGNVVTAKLRAPAEGYLKSGHAPHVVEAVNARLPAHLRVLSAVRVVNGFHGYQDAVGRVYHYFLPIEALLPCGTAPDGASSGAVKRAIVSFNSILGELVGTHHFHNFTTAKVRRTKVTPIDAQAWRRLESVATGGDGSDAAGLHDCDPLESEDSFERSHSQDGLEGGLRLEGSLGKPPANVRFGVNRRPLGAAQLGRLSTVAMALGASDGVSSSDRSSPVAPLAKAFPSAVNSDAERYLAICRLVLRHDAAEAGSEDPEGLHPHPPKHRLASGALHSWGGWADAGAWTYENDAGRTIYSFAAGEHAWQVLRGPEGQLVLQDRANVAGDILDWSRGAHALEGATSQPLHFSRLESLPGAGQGAAYDAPASSATGSAPGAGWSPVGRLVRVTVHGSGFLLHQIRLMLGAALGELHGALPPGYVRALKALPLAPRPPLAPAGGLVQGEVHFAANSFVTWSHPGGAAAGEACQPVAGFALREAHMDDPAHTDATAAATQSADACLMTPAALAARTRFFESSLLPRLVEFAGWAQQREAQQQAQQQAGDPARVSPLEETLPQWMGALLSPTGSLRPSGEAARAAMEWHGAMRGSWEAREAGALEASRAERAHHVRRLWAREHGEDAHAPTDMRAPVHLAAHSENSDSGPDGAASEAREYLPLQHASLAEVSSYLLPRGLASAVATATGLVHHREILDILRAVAFRVMRAEWPALPPPGAHAGWVVATGVPLLVREGKLLFHLDRAGVKQAAKFTQLRARGVLSRSSDSGGAEVDGHAFPASTSRYGHITGGVGERDGTGANHSPRSIATGSSGNARPSRERLVQAKPERWRR